MEENQSSSSSSNGSNSKKWIMIAVAVVVILAIAGGGFLFLSNKEENSPSEMTEGANSTNNNEQATQPTSVPDAMTSESPSATDTASTSSAYKDGTYSAVGNYQTHGGPESIAVKITLSNGVVTAVVVTEQPKDQMSKMMQEDFIANFKPMVVGKNIDSIKLGKVSGSSLTPMGFNAAVETIKTQAKS
jgi:uncharacterized protein with FMN-binding domain